MCFRGRTKRELSGNKDPPLAVQMDRAGSSSVPTPGLLPKVRPAAISRGGRSVLPIN